MGRRHNRNTRTPMPPIQWVKLLQNSMHPVSYTHLDVYKRQDGIMAVFTGENLCIPFRDPDGGQVWDDLCRFLKEKNPSIVI